VPGEGLLRPGPAKRRGKADARTDDSLPLFGGVACGVRPFRHENERNSIYANGETPSG
jgi:hypothetical protein